MLLQLLLFDTHLQNVAREIDRLYLKALHFSATQLGNLLLTIKITHPIALVIVTHSSELAGNMQVIYKLIDGKLEFSADQ